MGARKPGGESPAPLMNRFARACLLVLAGVFALWLALQLLGQIWGWLLLIAAAIGATWVLVQLVQWWRNGRW